MPDNRILTIHCTMLRCRQAVPGWYEGALHFLQDQEEFSAGADDQH